TRATPQVSLPLEEVTIAEALKEAGYRTAHMGKWHLQSYNDPGRSHFPEAQGFDINIAGHHKGQPASYFYPYKARDAKYEKNNVPDLEGGKEGEYLTDHLTNEAIKFINSEDDAPFLLHLWYYTVHTPVQGKPEKVAKYKAKAEELGFKKDEENVIAETERWSDTRQDDPEYAAMVESMDENVGRVLEALKASGKDQNTVIIFTSDNGGLSTGKNKKAPTSCLPLRAGKAWIYEGGIRQPLIVKWPGQTKAGRICDTPVTSTDFYPTILELAGLDLRPEQHLDGLSLASLLKDETSTLQREALFFNHPHDHHINGMGSSGAVRVADYKLVASYNNGQTELYDLKNDIGEKHDLSEKMPEKTKELKELLNQWREETNLK
ncbi:MAG: sulfatase, partial [Verrucomicrobiota bacterium]